MSKPLLKWAGGKRKLAPALALEIVDFLGASGGWYFEPFLGSGAVALALGLDNMMLSDASPELITFHRAVQKRPLSLHKTLQILIDSGLDEEAYYRIRDMAPLSEDLIAARLVYLNKTCRSGLHRVNSRGLFNVPWGKYKAPRFPTLAEIGNASLQLERSEIGCVDFQKAIDESKPGDLIYADPPYHETFNQYTAGKFNEADQARLAAALHRAYQRGVYIIASNADTPFIQKLYSWAEFSREDESRPVNSNPEDRGKAPCVLIRAR